MFQHVEGLKAHVTLCRSHTALLNTFAVAKEIISFNFPAALQSEIDRKVFSHVQEQLKKLEPAFEYFDRKMVELPQQVAVYQSARMFHPKYAIVMGLTPQMVGILAAQLNALMLSKSNCLRFELY